MALLNMGELNSLRKCDYGLVECEESQCMYRKDMNCDMSKETPVFELVEFGDDIKLTSCPLHYVSPAVREFVQEYQHFEKWGGLPHLDDLSARWQTASVYYNSYVISVQNEIVKRERKKNRK